MRAFLKENENVTISLEHTESLPMVSAMSRDLHHMEESEYSFSSLLPGSPDRSARGRRVLSHGIFRSDQDQCGTS